MSKGQFIVIPDVGTAYVTAGIGFFDLRFGTEFVNASTENDAPMLRVNSKVYRGTIEISAESGAVNTRAGLFSNIALFGSLTDAAKRKVRPLIESWAAVWVQSDEARSMRAPVVERHNRINEERLRRDIEAARSHLAELEMLVEKFRAVDDPSEYVETWRTTYELRERS
jgi:hypothetical protein